MIQDIHSKVIFLINNISTSRFSRLIINPKLSIVTLKFAPISKSRLAVPRHSRTNDSDYHKDTLPAPTGHMKTINYLYTLAPLKNKILMKPKQYCNLFLFLFCLGELFRDNQPPAFLSGVFSNFHGFDLSLKFLWEETSLLCFE